MRLHQHQVRGHSEGAVDVGRDVHGRRLWQTGPDTARSSRWSGRRGALLPCVAPRSRGRRARTFSLKRTAIASRTPFPPTKKIRPSENNVDHIKK